MAKSGASETGYREATFDVVIAGYGYAGAVAAIEAHDAGASTVIVEKACAPGGISICSAGGIRTTGDPAQALKYLERTNAGTAPVDVLKQLADGMATVPDYVRRLAQVNGAQIVVRDAPANYPFCGHRAFGFVYVDGIPGFDPATAFPHVAGSPAGAMLFKVLMDNVAKRNIPVLLQSPVVRIFRNDSGCVAGVVTGGAREKRRIRARRAVVLACGGFEGSGQMQQRHFPGGPVASAAYLQNTGDGIRLAQEVGADLWHMWHFHGSYGFHHTDPSYPYAIRVKRLPDWCPGEVKTLPKMAWVLLDQNGRRFMNEYEPYMQDTGARPFSHYSPTTQTFARQPAHLVVDDVGRRLYPLGKPTYHDRQCTFTWSSDNLAEVDLGILKRCDTVAELAMAMDTTEENVAASLKTWNEACAKGEDGAFQRPPGSMAPISQPPYFTGKVWPLVSNTQGGPVHDCQQRILNGFGEPLPRLYAAGELGSVFGHLYLSGGNLAECFVGGAIAGRNAANQV